MSPPARVPLENLILLQRGLTVPSVLLLVLRGPSSLRRVQYPLPGLLFGYISRDILNIKKNTNTSVLGLHLPHCEIQRGDFLSVAHVEDEGVEFLRPREVTETHVVVDVSGLSGNWNASSEMVEFLKEDSFLCDHLGLM